MAGWAAGAGWIPERADVSLPGDGGSGGVVFVGVPEGTVVGRIDRKHRVVAPAPVRMGLRAGAGQQRGLALRQRPQRIADEPAGVTNRWESVTAGGAVA